MNEGGRQAGESMEKGRRDGEWGRAGRELTEGEGGS